MADKLGTIIVTEKTILTLNANGAQDHGWSGTRRPTSALLDMALGRVRFGGARIIVSDPEVVELLRSDPDTFREVTPPGGVAEFVSAVQ